MGRAAGTPVPLAPVDRLELVNVRAAAVRYEGKAAIRLTEDSSKPQTPDMPLLAILAGPEVSDGSIELFVAGRLPEGASAGARGFVGLAFHVQEGGGRYQVLYLRPTNARAEDQLRRNHTTQYQALPGYPWHRLRAEQPSMFESYVDLEAGRWTKLRIELKGNTARLYVNGHPQPALIVNDLKTPDRSGRLALWIGPETVGYFAGLRVEAGK
ncbi:MAG: hypothetical protein HOP28_03130 [Gemmatimonadales bacterium]|nr:hypothetical protein [Gemmatimonadales bacterium]